ncbi:hypothetical protein DSO57_1035982 [Entomophthora muscae]|uniref:Uncharacterized protein n=2 Tax=Entomophthora muscae TaxID=34485 RepID=A0ACC2RQD6_9FUNG|nr:hypothetical protein DSO57_1035982 [Entomophthora muscae]
MMNIESVDAGSSDKRESRMGVLSDEQAFKKLKLEASLATDLIKVFPNVYTQSDMEMGSLSIEDQSTPSSSLKELVCWLKGTDPTQTSQILACLRSKFGLLSISDRKFDWVVSSLFKQLEKAPTDTLRAVFIRTISLFCRFPEATPSHALALYLQRIEVETSVTCKKAIYSAIYDIMATKLRSEGNTAFLKQIMYMCWEDLKSPSHIMRCSSINLFGLLASKKVAETLPLSADDIQVLLVNFGDDPDPRVRKDAIKALTNLHLRGSICKPSHYQLCVLRMKDEYEDVRLTSLDLLGLVCGTYPDEMVEVEADKVRLIDDAFVNVCNIVHDSSPRVRSKGFQLLGNLHKADNKLLLQTFSKKMIARNRNDPEPTQPQAPNPNRTTQITADGEYEMEPDEVRILKSGECGAFIHGLEDEFQEVRAASVDSICELCMNSQEFATRAVDFLVDAFNDEIDTVRMNSIASLAKIRSAFPLTIDEEQLLIVLSVLEDKKPSIRSAVHEVLGLLLLDKATILPTLVNGLLANLRRHPGDLPTIYECLKLTGLRHARFCDEGFVLNLFQVDKKFLTKDGDTEDPIYIAKAILAFNASFVDARIVKYFPASLINHFSYLKYKFPLYLTESASEATDAGIDPKSILKPQANPDSEKLLSLFKTTTENIPKLDFIEENLPKIKEFNTTFVYLTSNLASKAGMAKFLATLLDALTIVIESQRKAYHSFDGLFLDGSKLLDLSYQLEYQFLGTNKEIKLFFAELRVLASLYCYISKLVSEPSHWFNSNRALVFIIKRVQSSIDMQPHSSTHLYLSNIIKILSNFAAMDGSKSEEFGLGKLIKISMDYPIRLPSLPGVIKESKAAILKPLTNPYKPREVVSGLPLRLAIEGELYFVDEVSSICIHICFPDKSTQTITPPASSFTMQSHLHYKLQTEISLLLPAWREPCSFQIRIVKKFTTETLFDPALLCASRGHGLVNARPKSQIQATVFLSEPLEIFTQCYKP